MAAVGAQKKSSPSLITSANYSFKINLSTAREFNASDNVTSKPSDVGQSDLTS